MDGGLRPSTGEKKIHGVSLYGVLRRPQVYLSDVCRRFITRLFKKKKNLVDVPEAGRFEACFVEIKEERLNLSAHPTEKRSALLHDLDILLTFQGRSIPDLVCCAS